MPIFSRRIVQRLLDENRAFLAESIVSDHVRRLNAQDESSIAAEWEIALLNAFSKIGKIDYQTEITGSARPDVSFRSEMTMPFVAEITTVSDENYNKENPVDYFYAHLADFFRRRGLSMKGITVEVDSEELGQYGDKRVRLKLPPKKDVPSFVKKNSTLSFVVVITPEERHSTLPNRSDKYLKVTSFVNPEARFPVDDGFQQALESMKDHLPKPQSMPRDAISYLRSTKDKGHSFLGGFSMTTDQIKLSSRMITELLAGVLDYRKFDEDCKARAPDRRNFMKEFFLRQLADGKMIQEIAVESSPEEDDDRIVIKYGKPDTAISKFR